MCHGFDAVPESDGVHEMMRPEAGCASVECHGWDSLIGRYHQASDMSLNVWILMPVALVLGLWLLVRRMGRPGRVHDDSRADDGMAEASSPVASSERHCGGNLMTPLAKRRPVVKRSHVLFDVVVLAVYLLAANPALTGIPPHA